MSLPTPVITESLSGGLPMTMLHRPGPAILSARLVIRGGSSLDPRDVAGPISCWLD